MQLPAPIIGLVLAYEGSIVRAYAKALVRRVTVRSYQRILGRRFRFYMLDRFCLAHLVRLIHTAFHSIQRYHGVLSTRVYRKCLIPWLPMINRLSIRTEVHNTLVNLVQLPD